MALVETETKISSVAGDVQTTDTRVRAGTGASANASAVRRLAERCADAVAAPVSAAAAAVGLPPFTPLPMDRELARAAAVVLGAGASPLLPAFSHFHF